MSALRNFTFAKALMEIDGEVLTLDVLGVLVEGGEGNAAGLAMNLNGEQEPTPAEMRVIEGSLFVLDELDMVRRTLVQPGVSSVFNIWEPTGRGRSFHEWLGRA